MLKIQDDGKISDEVFRVLNVSLNNIINFIPIIDLDVFFKIRSKIDKDKIDEMEKIETLFQNCNVTAIRRIKDDSQNLVIQAIFFKHAGGYIYLIPFFVIYIGYTKAKSIIKDLLFLPEAEVAVLFPESLFLSIV